MCWNLMKNFYPDRWDTPASISNTDGKRRGIRWTNKLVDKKNEENLPQFLLKFLSIQGHVWANKFKGGLKKTRFGKLSNHPRTKNLPKTNYSNLMDGNKFFLFVTLNNIHWHLSYMHERCSRSPRRASTSKHSI